MTRRPRFEVYPVHIHPGSAPGGIRTEWRWRLRAANGRVLASGEGFKSKRNAIRATRAVVHALAWAPTLAPVEVES